MRSNADPTVADAAGDQPIHRAVAENFPAVVATLIGAKASASAPGAGKNTPLHIMALVHLDDLRLTEVLLAHGAAKGGLDANRQGKSALELARFHGNSILAERLELAAADPHISMLAEALQQEPSRPRQESQRKSLDDVTKHSSSGTVLMVMDAPAPAPAAAPAMPTRAVSVTSVSRTAKDVAPAADVFEAAVAAIEADTFQTARDAFQHTHSRELIVLRNAMMGRDSLTTRAVSSDAAAIHALYAGLLGEALQAALGDSGITWAALTRACARAVRDGRCGGERLASLRFLAAVDDIDCFIELMTAAVPDGTAAVEGNAMAGAARTLKPPAIDPNASTVGGAMVTGARGRAAAARARATAAAPHYTMPPTPLLIPSSLLRLKDTDSPVGKGALSAAERLRQLAMAQEDATDLVNARGIEAAVVGSTAPSGPPPLSKQLSATERRLGAMVPPPLSKQPSASRPTNDAELPPSLSKRPSAQGLPGATVPPPLSRQPSNKQPAGMTLPPLSRQPSSKQPGEGAPPPISRQSSSSMQTGAEWHPSARSALELASSIVLGAHLAGTAMNTSGTATLSGHPAAAVRSARGSASASFAGLMQPNGYPLAPGAEPSDTSTSYQSGLRSIDLIRSVMTDDTLASVASDWPFMGGLTVPIVLTADEPVMLPGLAGLDWADGIAEWLRGRRLGAGTSGVVFLASPHAEAAEADASGEQAEGVSAVGGFGEVEIAAKHMQPRGEEAMAALRDEIRLMRRLHHQHVVRYLGVASGPRASDGQYILMEYCSGGSVGGLLRQRQYEGLPHSMVHDYALQLLRGLHFLHENMVIHRDLKGDNVLLAPLPLAALASGGAGGAAAGEAGGVPPMRVKIADFGSASELEYGTTADNDADARSHMRGSPYWMAPEHIKGAACGRKADIWSYGGVLLEMISGRPPWFEERRDAPSGSFVVFQLLYRIAESQGPPPLLPAERMPFGYEALLRACFERDTTRRPDSAEVMRRLQSMKEQSVVATGLTSYSKWLD